MDEALLLIGILLESTWLLLACESLSSVKGIDSSWLGNGSFLLLGMPLCDRLRVESGCCLVVSMGSVFAESTVIRRVETERLSISWSGSDMCSSAALSSVGAAGALSTSGLSSAK